jgi:hypothetical protein
VVLGVGEKGIGCDMLGVHVQMCTVHVRAYVCVCICVYICVYVCVCIRTHECMPVHT